MFEGVADFDELKTHHSTAFLMHQLLTKLQDTYPLDHSTAVATKFYSKLYRALLFDHMQVQRIERLMMSNSCLFRDGKHLFGPKDSIEEMKPFFEAIIAKVEGKTMTDEHFQLF